MVPDDSEEPEGTRSSEAARRLSEVKCAVLDFEALWWKYSAVKAERIRAQFAMTETRYYQVVNALLDRPEALAYAPGTVARLRRLRSARASARSDPR